MPILFGLLTFISTFLGGLFGLKYQKHLHLILGFTAGVLLAVVSFDLFPEIIKSVEKLRVEPIYPMIAFVVGFLTFHIFEETVALHHHSNSYQKHHHLSDQHNPTVGLLSALAVIGHSFTDGLGIGLGFQVSPQLGILLTIAVIGHDFCDGLNTVSLMLLNKNSYHRSFVMLILDALAPILGIISTFFFTLPANLMLLFLAGFAGVLLYIGASDVLPEAHAKNSSYLTVLATVLGVLFIFFVTRLV